MSDKMLDRSRLPIRRPTFEGVVKRTLDGSEPDWNFIAPIPAPDGAPNVLLVLTDDAGFGNPSRFGGPISTPTMERLAVGRAEVQPVPHDGAVLADAGGADDRPEPSCGGLRDGRRVRGAVPGLFGEPAEGLQPFPKTLQGNGYATACFGKWHLTPDNMQGPSGPFDRWPNAVGFDYFWGFLGGESGQFDPVMIENNTRDRRSGGRRTSTSPTRWPTRRSSGCTASAPTARTSRGSPTSRPGAATRRIRCTPEWSDKYKGKFDQGWDKLREETFARQKQLGVIPADAELTPRSRGDACLGLARREP